MHSLALAHLSGDDYFFALLPLTLFSVGESVFSLGYLATLIFLINSLLLGVL